MFGIKCWLNKKEKYDLKQTVEKVSIRCSNFGKKTMIDLNPLEANYQEIITNFALDTILQHVGMIWIIENHEDLKYDMEIQYSDWMTGGPWYNTYICNKIQGKLFW